MDKSVTIKDLQNGDFFSPLSQPHLTYQLNNKFAFTRPSKNPNLDYERYAIATNMNMSKGTYSRRSFIHSTLVIKRN